MQNQDHEEMINLIAEATGVSDVVEEAKVSCIILPLSKIPDMIKRKHKSLLEVETS